MYAVLDHRYERMHANEMACRGRCFAAGLNVIRNRPPKHCMHGCRIVWREHQQVLAGAAAMKVLIC
jgi:hypothetical protein